MRPVVAILVALVGCYSPSYRDCEVSCPTMACPSGLECVVGMCRVPGATQSCSAVLGDAGGGGADSNPLADDDNDRVLNGEDNCPIVANTDQLNEDNDARGDVCDPCPILAPDGNFDPDRDSDTDGVGDGCDPFPNTQGDKIVLFEGFNSQTSNANVVFGNWDISNGSATIAAGASGSLLGWNTSLMPSQRMHYIATSATILSASTSNAGWGAGPIDGLFNGYPGISCMVGMDVQGLNGLSLNQSNEQQETPFASSFGNEVVQMGQSYPVMLVRRPPVGTGSGSGAGLYNCQGAQTTVEGTPNTFTNTTTPMIGIHARNLTVSFPFVFVVDSPIP